MRVIVVNDYGFVNGGASQVAISSVNALAEIGCDVTFVSAVGPIDPSINIEKVRVVNFGLQDLLGNSSKTYSAMFGLWNPFVAQKFSSLLDNFNPSDTIIHFHSWTKSLTSSVMRVAIKQKFHVTLTLHDYFTVCPNGGLYNYKTNEHCLKKPLSAGCVFSNCDSRSIAQKNWRLIRTQLQNSIGLVPGGIKNFITITEYSENILRPLIEMSGRYFRVRNPIDIPYIPALSENRSAIFTFVGRLSSEKGAVIFAEAAKLANVQGVFVGDGPLVDKLKLINNNLEFTGWLRRADVMARIRASKAIVFPSLWHETQGLVVSEAAALGISSIVSDGCAAANCIIDGETGLLFEHGNVKSLASKLFHLTENSERANLMGKNAHQLYWSNPPTLSAHAHDLVNTYEKILKTS